MRCLDCAERTALAVEAAYTLKDCQSQPFEPKLGNSGGPTREPSPKRHSVCSSGSLESLCETQDGTTDVTSDMTEETTCMIQDMPSWLTRQQLEELLDAEGFAGWFNFLYLPADLATREGYGYAFINVVAQKDVEHFKNHFTGFDRWPVPCKEQASVQVSTGPQGLSRQIERYRNSALMHDRVPDMLRPAIYHDGIRVPFPEPTMRVRPPRVRLTLSRKKTHMQNIGAL